MKTEFHVLTTNILDFVIKQKQPVFTVMYLDSMFCFQ